MLFRSKDRGYNFLWSRAYAIQLTKPNPNKRFGYNNQPYQEAIGGCNHQCYEQIMRFALSSQEAADQVERICTGVIQVPEIGPRQYAPVAQISEKMIETLAQNRANAIASQSLSEISALKAKMQEELAEVQKLKDSLKTPEKPRRGRPPGSKNKPKTKNGEAELTEEQEAQLAKVNFGPQA